MYGIHELNSGVLDRPGLPSTADGVALATQKGFGGTQLPLTSGAYGR